MKFRTRFVSVLNELFAVEMCPYKPGQLIRIFSPTSKTSRPAIVYAVQYRREPPYYRIRARDYDPETGTFLSRPVAVDIRRITANARFAMTSDFRDRAMRWYAAGDIQHMPMTEEQIRQLVVNLRYFVEGVTRFNPEIDPVGCAKQLELALAGKPRRVMLDALDDRSI